MKKALWAGMAAATLGGLLFVPASGWLVRVQLMMTTSGPLFGQSLGWPDSNDKASANRAKQAVRVAAQNPNDVNVQMAAREWMMPTPTPSDAAANTGTRHADALRPLLANYSDRPALHAALLRYLSQNAVHISDRPEVNLLTDTKPHKVVAEPDKNQNLPENLVLWEQSAQAGERLDPDNAYFPLMHAVGLFAARRDEEALQAVLRASTKPRYDDYLTDEVQGQMRLMQQAQGETGYIPHLAVSAAQLYPHYAQIGQAARLATVQAVWAEKAGDTERGFQIRRAVIQIGARMRTDSHPVIGSLVGRAISVRAFVRPGGAPPLPKVPYNDDRAVEKTAQNKRLQENLDRYCAYLTRIGHGGDVAGVRYETEAGQKMRRVLETAEGRPENIMQLRPAYRLIAWWATGVGLLTNLFVLLVVGGLCALFAARNTRLREGLPLLPAARAGMVSAFVLPAWGFGVAFMWPETPSLVLLLAGSVALGLLVWKAARYHGTPSETATPGKNPWAAALNGQNVNGFWNGFCNTLMVIGGLAAVSMVGPMQTLQFGSGLMGLRPPGGSGTLMLLTGAGLGTGISLLLALFLLIHSRIKCVPVSVGVIRGFRRLALPVAFVLVLVYAGVVCQTLREEARATQDLQTCMEKGEGRYLSGLVHQSWPGTLEKTKGSQK